MLPGWNTHLEGPMIVPSQLSLHEHNLQQDSVDKQSVRSRVLAKLIEQALVMARAHEKSSTLFLLAIEFVHTLKQSSPDNNNQHPLIAAGIEFLLCKRC